jgi:hypothetical protein
MTPEAKKQLEEMAGNLAHDNEVSRFDAYHFNAFMAGAQAAWELSDLDCLRRIEKVVIAMGQALLDAVKAERSRCETSADLMMHDLATGETWVEALRRHKHRILNPQE